MTDDSVKFRTALSRFASGVTVITAVDAAGVAQGVTVSSFCSLSLHPPLVLFCIGKKTSSLDACARGASFTVNILSEAQKSLSEAFASQDRDKFAGVEFTIGANGCPTLAGCLAVLECRRVETYDGGDHLIVVGQVDHISGSGDDGPLLRFRGRYRRIGVVC